MEHQEKIGLKPKFLGGISYPQLKLRAIEDVSNQAFTTTNPQLKLRAIEGVSNQAFAISILQPKLRANESVSNLAVAITQPSESCHPRECGDPFANREITQAGMTRLRGQHISYQHISILSH